MTPGNDKTLVNFLFELGQLKRVKRSGWWLLGITNPESVAEHTFRAAALAYLLAQQEKKDAEHAAALCLFHDIHETRLNDLHKVGHRYIDFRQAERQAAAEQAAPLSGILPLLSEFQDQKTPESRIARDADLLENALQAKEYTEQGFPDAQNWIDNIRGILQTISAKRLLHRIEQGSMNDWWKPLKKIDR
ncbi:HD domain-containing protein [Candidatus Woesearchaeota archaeon]|nr:HD domain-containing protein [Candidatus Woesearchaeota archaeon]